MNIIKYTATLKIGFKKNKLMGINAEITAFNFFNIK